MSEPAVSIVCPYRNGAAFLPELIVSVQRQVMPDWEMLLVDDGSTDEGPGLVVDAASSDPRLRPLTAPPRAADAPPGPWWPRNYGLQQARTPWIAFLDVDDLWHPLKLKLQLELHRQYGLDLSVTGYARFHQGHQRLSSWRCPPPRLGYRRLLRGNVIPMLTVMVRRDWLEEGFRGVPHEDYLLWLTLFHRRPALSYGCLPQLLAAYRLHGANLTARRPALAAWVYDVHRRHGQSRLVSAASLLPWALHQLATDLRWRIRPVHGSLAMALASTVPWPLPP